MRGEAKNVVTHSEIIQNDTAHTSHNVCAPDKVIPMPNPKANSAGGNAICKLP